VRHSGFSVFPTFAVAVAFSLGGQCFLMNDLTMSCAIGEALGGNTSGVPEGDADLFPSLGVFVADDAVGAVAGTPTNRYLPNYVGSEGLADSKALKTLSKVDVKYRGLDTVDFTIPVSEDDLENIEPMLLGLVGQGEISHFEHRLVVSRVGGFYRYKVAVADGVDLLVPPQGRAYMGVMVHAGARACLSSADLQGAACEVLSWLLPDDDLAARLSISRIDGCLDVLMTERDFQLMCGQVARKSVVVVTRGRSRVPYLDCDRYTGFAVGKGEVHLRVYDKGLKAGKDGTWGMWSEVYAPGVEGYRVPDGYVLARFEWQLRRNFLKQIQTPDGRFSALTLAGFRQSAPMIFEYLCEHWFSLRGPARGGKHERPMLSVWKAVTAGFVDAPWSELSTEVKRVVGRAVGGDVDKLVGQSVGCLATAAAVLGHHSGADGPVSDGAMMAVLLQYIKRDRENWLSTCDRRYKQLAYASKNTRVDADAWVGQLLPLPAVVAAVGAL
jgi:hypothetical protein